MPISHFQLGNRTDTWLLYRLLEILLFQLYKWLFKERGKRLLAMIYQVSGCPFNNKITEFAVVSVKTAV
jgi:hypothetical protein